MNHHRGPRPETLLITLTGKDRPGVTSAIFRLYGYNANNASGQLDITNYVTVPTAFAITVNGVVATPEPSSVAVFGLGSLLAGCAGWRRRKTTSAQNE